MSRIKCNIDIIAGLNKVQEAPDIVLSSTHDAQNAVRKYRREIFGDTN